MTPGKDEYTVYQGSDLRRGYRWTKGGDQVSLVGARAKIQFRKSVKGELIHEMSTTNGLITISGNWLVLNFTAPSTSAIDISDRVKLFGHLEVTLLNGRTFRLVESTVTFEPEITK